MGRSQREEVIGLLWLILATALFAVNAPQWMVWLCAGKGLLDHAASIIYAIKDRNQPHD